MTATGHTTNYTKVRPFIYDGDMLLLRGGGIIPWGSEGDYSHAMLALRRRQVLGVAESREWHGGRVVTLTSQIRRFPGLIDVYRPKASQKLKDSAADIAFRQAGHGYNYRGILWASVLRMPLLRFALEGTIGLRIDATVGSHTSWESPKFCSQLVIWCYREAAERMGYPFDPVPGKADAFVTPSDLSHSAAFEKVFEGLVL